MHQTNELHSNNSLLDPLLEISVGIFLIGTKLEKHFIVPKRTKNFSFGSLQNKLQIH